MAHGVIEQAGQSGQTFDGSYALALDMYLRPGVHRGFDTIGPVLRQARLELEELTRAAVVRAIGRGEPWVNIGKALGVSRQAAQKKYGHLT